MPKKICHLLLLYGNRDQQYTQDMLENIKIFSSEEHFIYCHAKKATSHKIMVIESKKNSKITALLQFIGLLNDLNFRTLIKKLSKYDIYKWVWLAANKIDILHIHHAHAIPVAVLTYFKIKGVKIVISLRGRDLLVNTVQNEEATLLYAKLQLADSIHCISEYLKNELFQKFGLHAQVVHRGQMLPDKNGIRQLANQSEKIKIIAVGRLVWEKGHIYIIESASRLKEKGYAVEVHIFGEGVLREFLQFRIDQLNLHDVVLLKGFVENDTLKSLYNNYDIAVQPSLSEALSNGLIDFMFHNLPCVITDVGGMPEIIQHNKNGIVFSKKNMLLLDKAILDAKKLDFDELVEHNNEIRPHFTQKREIEGLLKLYDELG